jgi:hypothetical protein
MGATRRLHGAAMCAAVAVSACGISPTNLKPPAHETVIELATRFAYETSGGLGPVRMEHSLTPGAYRAVAEDDMGTFYQGPRLCYSIKVLDPGLALREDTRGKVLRYQDCGIYVPKAAGEPARVYVVLGSESPTPPAPPPGTLEVGLMNTFVGPTAGPSAQMQGAVGVGIGLGVVEALVAAEKGNFNFIQQPSGNLLREALTASAGNRTLRSKESP